MRLLSSTVPVFSCVPANDVTIMNAFFVTVSSPTSEESFQFGGYMPSAASSSQSRSRGGLVRPDTAPSSTKRSVRFSDDLGLGDELFRSERPSTAPGERSGRRQPKREDKDDGINNPAKSDTRSNGRKLRFYVAVSRASIKIFAATS